MSHGLIFSRSPLSHLMKQEQKHYLVILPHCVYDYNPLFQLRWTVTVAKLLENHTDVLHCVALKQAVWILELQRFLVLHRAEPPGVIDDAAKPHTCEDGIERK